MLQTACQHLVKYNHNKVMFTSLVSGKSDDVDLGEKPGFVALAHPSSLDVGKGHGVYIMSDLNPDLDTGTHEALPET